MLTVTRGKKPNQRSPKQYKELPGHPILAYVKMTKTSKASYSSSSDMVSGAIFPFP